MIKLLNKFFGFRHYYVVPYSIYENSVLINIGLSSVSLHRKSDIVNYDNVKLLLISGLDESQKALLRNGANVIITGISYLGYFKK